MAKSKSTISKNPTTKKPRKPRSNNKDEGFVKRRNDWEINNELISSMFIEYVLKHKKYPSFKAIADKTGLSVMTVIRHYQDGDMLDDMKTKLRALSERSLITIGIKAIKGESVHWSRLFHEIVDGFGSKKSIDITSKGKEIKSMPGNLISKIEVVHTNKK